MAGDALKHVVSGERIDIKSATWNRFIDAAKAHQENRVRTHTQPLKGLSNRLEVLVENTTGVDQNADFPILHIDGPVFNTTDRADVIWDDNVVLKGKAPTSATRLDDIAVLQGPCPAGDFRKAVVSGPTWVNVAVVDVNHTRVVPRFSSTVLDSSHSGALILWKETGIGVKRSLVLLGTTGPEIILVKPVANIAARSGVNVSSGSCEIVQDVGGVLSGLGVNLQVKNVYDQVLQSGKYVLAAYEVKSKAWFAVYPGTGGGRAVIAKTSPGSGIAARSGTNVSSQSCELFGIDGTNMLLTTSEFADVFNVTDTEVPADSYFPAVEEEHTGRLIAAVTGGGGEAFIAKTSPGTGIAARSGLTVSNQSCEIFSIAAGTTLTATGQFQIVYNVADQEVPADTYFPIVQEQSSGLYVAAFGGEGGAEAIIVKTSPGSAIAARNGVTMSSQSCEVFSITGGTTLVTTGNFETILNVESRPVPADEYFTAVKDKNSGLWIAVVPLGYDRCKALAKGAFTLASSTFTVDNVVATKGRNPVAALTDELTVSNEFGWDGDDNARVYIEWHESTSDWRAYQVACTSS